MKVQLPGGVCEPVFPPKSAPMFRVTNSGVDHGEGLQGNNNTKGTLVKQIVQPKRLNSV